MPRFAPFTQMFELQNEKGEQLFKTISITLVCDECAASAHPELCTHKLGSLPRWISSSKVETVRTLLSEDPAMILRETLGIAADGSNKAYSHDDVAAMMNDKPLPVTLNPRRSSENQESAARQEPSQCNRRHLPTPGTDVLFCGGRPVRGWPQCLFHRVDHVDKRSAASGGLHRAHFRPPHRPHYASSDDKPVGGLHERIRVSRNQQR
jgi:hypothetical protein